MTFVLLLILALLLAAFIYCLLISIDIQYEYNLAARAGSVVIAIFPIRFKSAKRARKVKQAGEVKDDAEVKKSKPRRRLNWTILLAEIDYLKTVLIQVLIFLFRLVRFPDRYHCDIQLEGGVGAPDLTGYLYGSYRMLQAQLSRLGQIAFQPDFDAERLSGTISVGLNFRLVMLLKELLIFIWKLPKLKTIGIIRKLRKGSKDV